jgi:isocitrate/isopropylmalate dehydrogenase
MTKRIAIIPGDGVGIEVTAEATKVLQAPTALRHLRVGWASCPQ